MIRLRGGALLVVGVGLLFVALSFIGAVAVHAMPHDGQGKQYASVLLWAFAWRSRSKI